jgi:endonuclease G
MTALGRHVRGAAAPARPSRRILPLAVETKDQSTALSQRRGKEARVKPPNTQQLKAAATRFSTEAASEVAHEPTFLKQDRVKARPVDRRLQQVSERLSQSRARSMVLEAESRGAPHDPQQTLALLANERIIGQTDIVGINYLELAVAISRAVCRVRIGSAAGTGFMVGFRLLMTNHHVLHTREEALQAEAQFDYQENRSGELLPVRTFRFDPTHFFFTDDGLDFTVIGLAETTAQGIPISRYPWVKLLGQPRKSDEGSPLNIIQHPRGGLKQVALRHNEIIRIPEGKSSFLYYTTDTEPGSSGSPCFNDQWELVALHHSGVPRVEQGKILRRDRQPWREGLDDPELIDWIANEGARISAIVASLRGAQLEAATTDLVAKMLEEEPPNPIELSRQDTTIQPMQLQAPIGIGAGAGATFDIPLRITISLGATPISRSGGGSISIATGSQLGEPAPSSVRAPSEDALAAEAVVIDPDWSNRTGYDTDFLGTTVPLPGLSPKMKEITVELPTEYHRRGDPYILDYHHYSVAMNANRCFAWYSAANVDGERRFKLTRERDKWFLDPRIDADFQCGDELYAMTHTDRGHLTRYLDVAWGDSIDEAVRATNDSFHFTNCCLQLSGFNQSKSRWQGIEQFLLEKKAKKEKRRIVVITGPLFQDSDPYYQNNVMVYAVAIPLEFWKVCAIIRSDDTLAATAFVLGQKDVLALPGFEEAFDVTTTQVTLADLEDRTGLNFGQLTEHDHFAKGGAPGTLEIDRADGSTRKLIPIREFEDIVI